MNADIELCLAIQKENLEEVKKSIALGAGIHKRIDNNKYFTPWNWVFTCRNISIISQLLESGADADCPIDEVDGETVLFGMVLPKNIEGIGLLITHHANLNAIDDYGLTPLYLTIGKSFECMALVPYLLALGADITIGSDKITEFETTEKEGLKTFYSYIENFLDRLAKDNDYKRLKIHTERVMSLSEDFTLPESLVNKVIDLRQKFCLEGEEGSEDLSYGSLEDLLIRDTPKGEADR